MALEDTEVTVDEKAQTVTIVMPLEKPRQSKSGKTMVIASTLGNQRTDAKYKGHDVTIGVNVYYKADDEPEEEEKPKKKKGAKKEKEDDEDDDGDE